MADFTREEILAMVAAGESLSRPNCARPAWAGPRATPTQSGPNSSTRKPPRRCWWKT